MGRERAVKSDLGSTRNFGAVFVESSACWSSMVRWMHGSISHQHSNEEYYSRLLLSSLSLNVHAQQKLGT